MYIYKITNLINGKIYIGQTRGTIHRRWVIHKSAARRGEKYYLYRAIRKYGIDNFKIEALVRCSCSDILNKYEEILISKYNTLPPNGYNLKLGGDSTGVCKESKIRMSKAQGGKPFLVRNLKTDEIMEFETQFECAEKLGINNKKISCCLRGVSHTSSYYSFSLKSSGKLPLSNEDILKIKRENLSKARGGKPIVAINTETHEVLEFNSQIECAEALGIDPTNICACLNNRKTRCGQYIFKNKKSPC